MADNPKKQQADAQFRKLQRAEDGKKAMSEYEAEVAATRAKTERLRALRLARDSAEEAAGPRPTAPAKKGKTTAKTATKAKTKKGAAVPLSNWLKSQQDSGRNN